MTDAELQAMFDELVDAVVVGKGLNTEESRKQASAHLMAVLGPLDELQLFEFACFAVSYTAGIQIGRQQVRREMGLEPNG